MWFESGTVEFVTETAPEWAALVFAALSYLGSVWFVAPVVAIAFWFGNRHRFGSWLAIVIGAYALMVGSKTFFNISRPDVEPTIAPESLPPVVEFLYSPMVEVHTTTFPSGHAIAAVVIWTMLALEAPWGTRRQRLAGAAIVVGLVGLGRVGVGVHYPIDILAGSLVGVAYLAVVLPLRRAAVDRLDWHRAVAVLFATAVGLALAAVVLGGGVEAAALAGGAAGALAAWFAAPPPEEPIGDPATAAATGVLGLGVLGGIVAVAVTVDFLTVWLLLGVVGGALVVGIPRLCSTWTISRPVADDQVSR